MNKALVFILVIVILAAGQVFAAKVTNVELSWQNGYTEARLDVQGAVRFSHQTEQAKDGKPFRVIVDVLAATHQLGQKNFFELPSCPVTKIRTSQYSVEPEQVVRVVFDMSGECVYQIKSDDKGVVVTFPDPKGKSFASWSSSSWIASQQAKPTTPAMAQAPAATPAATPVPAKTTAQVNTTINSDRLASLESQSTATGPSQTAPPAKAPVAVKATTPAAAPTGSKTAPANVSAPVKAEAPKPEASKPVVAATPTPAPAVTPTKASSERKVSTPVVAKPDNLTSDVPRQPDLKIEPPQPMMVADAETPTPEKASKPAVSSPTKPAAQKPAEVAQPKPAVTTPAQSAAPKPAPAVTKPAPAVAAQPSATKPAPTVQPSPATTPSVIPAVPEPVGEESEAAEGPEPEDLEPAVEQDDAAAQAQRSTARFRRSANPSKMKGTMVAEFPTRLVIKYEDAGRRDPFATLIDETKQYNSPIERRVPNVEGIRLVGVIESDLGNSALFEDKDGYGYILREGDKIQKGYVLRIQPDQVFFQIFEYGWSRTVALNLESE